MSTIETTQRRVLSVPRQLASADVRRKALATLRPDDVVQAVDSETLEVFGTRRLESIFESERIVYSSEPLGQRPWFFDADGHERHPWGDRKPGGLLLIRPWLAPGDAEHLLWTTANRPQRRFTWTLYEEHLAATLAAVVAGSTELPEEPWD